MAESRNLLPVQTPYPTGKGRAAAWTGCPDRCAAARQHPLLAKPQRGLPDHELTVSSGSWRTTRPTRPSPVSRPLRFIKVR